MSTRRQIAEHKAKELRKHVRQTYSPEEKLRIVLLGLKGDSNISELCQKEGINPNLYQIWSKEFLEGGRSRLYIALRHEKQVAELPAEHGPKLAKWFGPL